MKRYIGTKRINATPMNRQTYNEFRGWEVPADEEPSTPGYLVEYLDGGAPNTEDYEGYVSWSPKDVFERAYKSTDGMPLGQAIEELHAGNKVARAGWNGKDMFLFLVPGSIFNVNRAPLLGIYPEGTEVNYNAHVDMRKADGSIEPWLCSQSDLLATDWSVVE